MKMLIRHARHVHIPRPLYLPTRQTYATAAVAIAPSPSIDQIHHSSYSPIERHPSTQPPSYKPPFLRKSQLHRQYASLLRSTPLMLLFQHNNLRASEWTGIRRELATALRKTASSTPDALPSISDDPGAAIRLQIIQSGIFAAALRVVEFYQPPGTGSEPVHASEQHDHTPMHGLSLSAYEATKPSSGRKQPHAKRSTPLHALLSGPLAVLTFPTVTPQQLAIALKILAPTTGASSAFPAPRRKDVPGLYEPVVQNGLQKLLLLGARVEGRVMDQEGVRWVGGLSGIDNLRAQLVGILTGVGMGVTGALEGAGRSLWLSLEGRRMSMEEEKKGSGEKKEDAAV